LPYTCNGEAPRRAYRKHQQPTIRRIAVALAGIGIRNRDIAKALEVSPATVSRLLAGQQTEIMKVCEKLERLLVREAVISPYEAYANYLITRAKKLSAWL
jgi:predicted transcriptional regulator